MANEDGMQRERAIGRLEGRQDATDNTVAEMKDSIEKIDGKVDRILLHLEHQKGSRRALIAAVSTAGTFFGAIGAMLVEWFSSAPPPHH